MLQGNLQRGGDGDAKGSGERVGERDVSKSQETVNAARTPPVQAMERASRNKVKLILYVENILSTNMLC